MLGTNWDWVWFKIFSVVYPHNEVKGGIIVFESLVLVSGFCLDYLLNCSTVCNKTWCVGASSLAENLVKNIGFVI